MKKLILIALVCSALYTSAAGYFGIKPIVNEPNCFGANSGSISLSLVGGVAPYTYHWSDGSTAANQTNIPAGSYTVTVTDAQSATATFTIVVGEPYQLAASTNGWNGNIGDNNAQITLSVDGGTPAYTYEWSNGATTQNLTGLAPGTYYVTVTDAEGCTTTTNKTVTHPGHPHFYGAINTQDEDKTLAAGSNSNGMAEANKSNELNAKPELKSEDVLVYPNPASNLFTLKTTGEVKNALVTLLDLNGQTISQQKAESNETNVNVSNLPKGDYIVEIRTESGAISKAISVK